MDGTNRQSPHIFLLLCGATFYRTSLQIISIDVFLQNVTLNAYGPLWISIDFINGTDLDDRFGQGLEGEMDLDGRFGLL